MDLRTLRKAAAIPLLAACAACSRSGAAGVPPAVRYEAHVFAGGMAPAAGTLTNPFTGAGQAAADGEALFTAMNCDGCHGGGAVGAEGPSLVDGRWRNGGSDGAVFHSIYYGRPRGMPAYGGVMAGDAIWKIVTYLRSQPLPKDLPTESWQ